MKETEKPSDRFERTHDGPIRGDGRSHAIYEAIKPAAVQELCDRIISNGKEWGHIGIACQGTAFGRPSVEHSGGEYADGEGGLDIDIMSDPRGGRGAKGGNDMKKSGDEMSEKENEEWARKMCREHGFMPIYDAKDPKLRGKVYADERGRLMVFPIIRFTKKKRDGDYELDDAKCHGGNHIRKLGRLEDVMDKYGCETPVDLDRLIGGLIGKSGK